jgi:anti-sigma B factor antagonist
MHTNSQLTVTFSDDMPCCTRRVQLIGDADMATEELLTRELSQAIDGTTHIVIDMAGLRFIDASGVRALVRAVHIADAHAVEVRVCGCRGLVDTVLRITGIGDLLHLDERVSQLSSGGNTEGPDVP